ncbi:MAG: multiheme c-type cytochrome [Nitrospinaceae bacterium]|jgi:hypothetical protein|nr:multiheme c-type cytochrome [Nitrospinaceae bacterium]
MTAFACGLLLFFSGGPVLAATEGAEGCMDCHIKITPGIVQDYLSSTMANSIEGAHCADCHGNSHKTMEDYNLVDMPTAETCGECHEERLAEYRKGKHDLAWFAMKTQPAWHKIPDALSKEGYRGCSGCHKIGRKGYQGVLEGNMGALTHDKGLEEEQYHYGNAQCDACHTRHKFSRAEAKDPRACSNCHMGFDHPQWEMFTSSKHGIIWGIEDEDNNGRAPTCQKCHMNRGRHDVGTSWGFLGLRIPTKENVLAIIDAYGAVKESAPYELLAFNHMSVPELVDNLKNLADKLPSGNFDGVDDNPLWVLHRAKYLIAAGVLSGKDLQPTPVFTAAVVQGKFARGPDEFNELRMQMKRTCNQCHAKDYVQSHFDASDKVIRAADAVYAKAFDAVFTLYRHGKLEKPKNWTIGPNILEYYWARSSVEQELYLIFLEHRQRAFQGAFHASNDYAHWYGWAPLNTAVNEILEGSMQLCEDHAQCKADIQLIMDGYTDIVQNKKY